jgi:hypothetical protein
MVWKPADPARFSMLGLADPDPSGELVPEATTADVLVYGLVPPGARDPVEGILESVRADIEVLSTLHEPPIADVLEMLGRRLYVAILLLRRTDQRDPIPEVMLPREDAASDVAPQESDGHTTTPAPAPMMPIDDAPPLSGIHEQ